MQARLTHLTAWAMSLALQAAPAAHAADRPLPYDATVGVGVAKVYAGPGPHYYDTAELPAGAPVQVYDETPGGFCAIRPPEGSFSWVPASSLELLEDGVAEVTRAETPARVGSLLHDRRDAVHVRLDLGERVRVLARKEIDNVAWVQIAPPAGEFRWVRKTDLAKVGAGAPAAGATGGESNAGWVHAASHTTDGTETAAAEPNAAEAPSAQVVGARPLPPTGAADVASEHSDAAPRAEPPTTPIANLPADLRSGLAQLEVELSRQVAESPNLWRLDEIESRAAVLLSAATDESQRQAIRAFGARVDRFAAIANRYKATRGLAPQVALTKSTSPATMAPRVEPVAGSVAPVSGYDAIGVLRPVVSKRPNAPQYALVDTQGAIVSFITASPDLNLGPLVGKRVGVQGVKGFMPEYQQPHVKAERVASLEPRTR